MATLTTPIEFFAYEHLPPHLKTISQPFGELANRMYSNFKGSSGAQAEQAALGLQKLLEAKDCFVRAAV